jgi:hypothetical protein
MADKDTHNESKQSKDTKSLPWWHRLGFHRCEYAGYQGATVYKVKCKYCDYYRYEAWGEF